MKALLLIALSLLAVAGEKEKMEELYKEIKLEFPNVPDITAAGLKNTIDSNSKIIIVDVRSVEERRISTIQNSITEETFYQNQDSYKSHRIVAYCTIGYRSAKFIQAIRKKGFHAMNLAAGILACLHVGGVVIDSSGTETKKVHVYGKKWALAPIGYDQIY